MIQRPVGSPVVVNRHLARSVGAVSVAVSRAVLRGPERFVGAACWRWWVGWFRRLVVVQDGERRGKEQDDAKQHDPF